jgi:membrane-associated protease RseP (regulator of RpoE activity)
MSEVSEQHIDQHADSRNASQRLFDRVLGKQRIWLHVLLFVLTFFTTTVAGVGWRGLAHDMGDFASLPTGVLYAVLILTFLSAHEFGHFIAARIHGVDATLPYYIPMPGYLIGNINFGTLGAVIRTRSRVPSNKVMFDIGIAGPIAGFIVCLILLAIGFSTLPGIEYLQQIHPGYPNGILQPGTSELAFGNTLCFAAMKSLFANGNGYMPPMTEIYHYPFLCTGWFGLFVTALNLLPVGQLDGGHVTYTLFGRRTHRTLGQLTALGLFAISLPSTLLMVWPSELQFLGPIALPGGQMWLTWAIITTVFIRFHHPQSADESPLDARRKIVGYFGIAIFVLCFTPSPFIGV